MKTWAFVRSSAGGALNYKKDADKSSVLCPEFSHYLYFLWIPTLIYRDNYPRTSSCNWNKVFTDFIQFIACILYAHFMISAFCVPVFQNFGKQETTIGDVIVAAVSCSFPGGIIMLCGFFGVLHLWMNIFAEITMFADRMFYKDWWNSTSYARYYRTWNVIVHDWLYEYVYKELMELQKRYKLLGHNKTLPMLAVFLISAVVHEYIVSFSLRFFYPVLFVLFAGFGVLLMFVNTKSKQYNIFLWLTLILGSGIQVTLYSMEWYARINCPRIKEGLLDFAVPRSWYCDSSNSP